MGMLLLFSTAGTAMAQSITIAEIYNANGNLIGRVPSNAYPTFNEGLVGADGGKLVLVSDYTTTSDIPVYSGTWSNPGKIDVTIDLNGHKLTHNNTGSSSRGMVTAGGSNLKITDSTETAEGVYISNCPYCSVTVNSGSTFTLDYGMVENNGDGVAVQVSGTGALELQNRGKLKADRGNYGIYIFPNAAGESGTINMTGGIINSPGGIYAESGKITISGGVVGNNYGIVIDGDPLISIPKLVTIRGTDAAFSASEGSTGIVLLSNGNLDIIKEISNIENMYQVSIEDPLFVDCLITEAPVLNVTGLSKKYDGEPVRLTAKPSITEIEAGDQTYTVKYTYQWYKDGTGLEGETNPVLELPGDTADSGTYSCVASTGDQELTDGYELMIEKRSVVFTGKSETKPYTGSKITISGLEISGDGLPDGHTHNVEFLASGKAPGEYPGTITPQNEVVIKSGDKDVTANFDITVSSGTLTITKKDPVDPVVPGGTVLSFFCVDCRLPNTGFPTLHETLLPAQPKSVEYRDLRMKLHIPTLSTEVDLVTIPLVENSWPVEWLGDRAGVLEGSFAPGEGYSLIAAHNTLNDTEYGPFASLAQLQVNDLIFVSSRGKLMKYGVYANKLTEPDGFGTISAIASKEPGSIILLTCENEAVNGEYLNRRVVFAKPLGQ